MDRRVLVVDDERAMAELVRRHLEREGYACTVAGSAEEALQVFEVEPVPLVITDLRMGGMNGVDLLRRLRERSPLTEVILMSGLGTIEEAVEAMRRGAWDFITKPIQFDELDRTLERLLRTRSLEAENHRLKDLLRKKHRVEGIVGSSPPMAELARRITRVARTQSHVLVLGESGTGKELVARAIHFQGARTEGPFVPVHCGAIAAGLVESELFGHRKGAFTGAHAANPGLFRAADGGTIFLDEVAEMEPALQVKLLRVLQEGEIRPVGSTRPERCDARVIAATNRDLVREVEEGRFRQDLYYRLDVVSLRVPPLRDRREDIPELVAHFLAERVQEDPAVSVRGVSQGAMEALMAYAWPGNVRELENVIERTAALSERERIERDDLPERLRGPAALSAPPTPAGGGHPGLEAWERAGLAHALVASRGDKLEAARLLGLPRSTFYRKLKHHGLG
ncbi:MAG: sigma-54-dependent Fis family transcriptional regulator [Planctomycetes bacterium]|nr:sigma-54-dependent Fis family transcriptional regulator [Planctomycetota bacterium]